MYSGLDSKGNKNQGCIHSRLAGEASLDDPEMNNATQQLITQR